MSDKYLCSRFARGVILVWSESSVFRSVFGASGLSLDCPDNPPITIVQGSE